MPLSFGKETHNKVNIYFCIKQIFLTKFYAVTIAFSTYIIYSSGLLSSRSFAEARDDTLAMLYYGVFSLWSWVYKSIPVKLRVYPHLFATKGTLETKGTIGTKETKVMARTTFLLIATSLRSLRSLNSLRSLSPVVAGI